MKKCTIIAGLVLTNFALSGCEQGTQTKPPEAVQSKQQSLMNDGSASIQSVDPSQVTHGDLPVKYTGSVQFAAKYDVLVFVRLNQQGAGSYVARVHHFNATGNDFASMKARMEVAINYLRKKGNINGIPPESLNSPTLIRSFKNMAFAAPSNVLIYFDNPGLTYRDVPLFFTKDLEDGTPAKKNKAFYDAAGVDITLTEGANTIPAKAAYVRNYFTKGSGSGPGSSPITKPERFNYAFNFNMNIPSEDDPTKFDQLIFDPDGGNMGNGGPPP